MVARGEAPSFREVFSESRVEWLTDEEKTGREMIQFSFFLRASDGRILLFRRSDASHRLTRGASVLVSWSPVQEHFRKGSLFPASVHDVLDIFHHEIAPDFPLSPSLRYIGFAMNDLKGPKRYYFYLFEVACALTGKELVELAFRRGSERFFVKDKEEVLGAFSVAEFMEKNLLVNPVDTLLMQWLHKGCSAGVERLSETCLLAPFTGDCGEGGIPDDLIKQTIENNE